MVTESLDPEFALCAFNLRSRMMLLTGAGPLLVRALVLERPVAAAPGTDAEELNAAELELPSGDPPPTTPTGWLVRIR